MSQSSQTSYATVTWSWLRHIEKKRKGLLIVLRGGVIAGIYMNNGTEFKLREHKAACLLLFIAAFILTFHHVQRFEYLQYEDNYRWMLYDDSAWGEFAPTLSLMEKGEFIWGYLYHELTQRAHALFVTPLFMYPFIRFFGLYPGIPMVHIMFLIMFSTVPVFIYATAYKVFRSRTAAFLSGLMIATEPFIAENAAYISRHPPSVFFFGLSIFLVTVFLQRHDGKRSLPLTILLAAALGLSSISDGDGIGVVMVFAFSVLAMQIQRTGKGFSLMLDRRLMSRAMTVIMISGILYSVPVIRNYRNLGIAAPNWVASMHLAASNNDRISEVARSGETLFRELYTDWEPERPVYTPEIERKFALKVYPEYEYHMMYSGFFKKWVKEHPFDFAGIVARRFYQNITTYFSWHSTAIAITALMSLFFLRPFFGRSYHLLLIWFISGLLFSLIYLTFWHQMHQVMVLSVFGGFGIYSVYAAFNSGTSKVPYLRKVPGRSLLCFVAVVYPVAGASYYTKARIMMEPGTIDTKELNNYSLPVKTDRGFKKDYKDIRRKLPKEALLVTKLNPFLVNKIVRRDVLLSKLGYKFDAYGPEGLQNGWLIKTPKGWVYRFREDADYLPKAADYLKDAISSGRSVFSDFDPNMDRLRFQAREVFPGHKLKFYRIENYGKVFHIDNSWREQYHSSNITDHPNVFEVKGQVKTANTEYIFSIIDSPESRVTFLFESDDKRVIEDADIYITTNLSSPVDRFMQISADNNTWVDVELKADSGITTKSATLPGLLFGEKIYLRFFQGTPSNMHIKSFEVALKYKNNDAMVAHY